MVVVSAGCTDAAQAINKLAQGKALCLSLFASLSEAQARVETLEEDLERGRAVASVADIAAQVAQGNSTSSEEESANKETTSQSTCAADVLNEEQQLEHVEARADALCAEVHGLCMKIR